MNCGPVTPSSCRRMKRRAPALAAARAHFLRGFGEMRLDRQIELPREHDDLLPGGIAHRVGRVRGQRERQRGLVLERVADRETLREVAVGVRRVGRRKIEDRRAQHRAHAELQEGSRARIGEEVHVVAARDPAAQHFGGGETGAVVDEIRRRRIGASRGQMCCSSQTSSSRSSAMPRKRFIAACVWALTRPGSST